MDLVAAVAVGGAGVPQSPGGGKVMVVLVVLAIQKSCIYTTTWTFWWCPWSSGGYRWRWWYSGPGDRRNWWKWWIKVVLMVVQEMVVSAPIWWSGHNELIMQTLDLAVVVVAVVETQTFGGNGGSGIVLIAYPT